jgi:hypothetical protein
VLRFLAEFITSKPEDMQRQFVISYFLVDNSISIHEPPRHERFCTASPAAFA